MMLYPNAPRVETEKADNFFVDSIQPFREIDKAMKNSGDDSVFRRGLDEDDMNRLTDNVERILLLVN